MHAVIYAPLGRDAQVLSSILAAFHIDSVRCDSPDAFCAALDQTALMAIASEEGLTRCSAQQLAAQLAKQPFWSSIPILAIADADALIPGGPTSVLERLGNVTLLTRPLRHEVLMLAILSAQRTRGLQWQVRDQLEELNAHAAELERRVDERTAALSREVRERRQIELSLSEARRLESLGRLTGGVAHDFNNLLQVIASASALMRFQLKEQPALLKSVDSIARATAQGAQLTQQLLSFARRQPMQIADVRLQQHLPDIAQLLQHSLSKNIELSLRIPDDAWPVRTDLAQLEIALLNLVVNARDAMPDGGKVVLSVTNLRLPDAALPELQSLRGEFVQLALADEGEGMTPAVAAQAFEPFFTTKPLGKGTGLGLSQVYGYAQQSNGLAYLRTSDHGTTVHIVLPRGQEASAAAAPARADAGAEAGGDGQILAGKRVLCVEDDPFVAELAVEMFANMGCRVCCAHDADTALTSDFAQIDFVFSDVKMPGSMDGVEMARQLRRDHPALPIVLASGFLGDPARLDGLALEFIRKPYSLETINAAARAAIARLR
ncbi:signal transduction histidine kinase [Duganella sp. 1224]|uniref:response regulator n=1 Tax=Duganella sp. 1224 TaxID=2587052 RepID=UPI0015C94EEB|nr:response regulator [Duganella sp. 1224]NYE61552.1 signal transduction histidine kinase [Duganella sp. 1224]